MIQSSISQLGNDLYIFFKWKNMKLSSHIEMAQMKKCEPVHAVCEETVPWIPVSWLRLVLFSRCQAGPLIAFIRQTQNYKFITLVSEKVKWKSACRFLEKLNIAIPFDPAILLLQNLTSSYYRDSNTPMFIAARLIIIAVSFNNVYVHQLMNEHGKCGNHTQ